MIIRIQSLASIISKKAAENIGALVLDVKVGRASFSQTIEKARLLANSLVRKHLFLNVKKM